MNVKKLNEIPEISPLDLGFYSMSINPNKKSKITILNLLISFYRNIFLSFSCSG